MNYTDYIKLLEIIKPELEGIIVTPINDIEELVYNSVSDWLHENLDTKRGRIQILDETAEVVNEFNEAFLQVLKNTKEYDGRVSQFVRGMPRLSAAIKEHQVYANKIDWAKANISDTEKLVVNEIIDALQGNGLNKEIIQPLRDQIYLNVVGGNSLSGAKEDLKSLIVSTSDKKSKLNRYLKSTAAQSVDAYTGAVNKRLMDTFDYPVLIMSGSLIETSSKQCVKAIDELNGVFTEAQFEKELRPIAKENGLMENVTFKNLSLLKLHWGCRHEFTPSMAKSGDQIGQNEDYIDGRVEKIKQGDGSSIKKKRKEQVLYTDPLLIGPFKDTYDLLRKKIAPPLRKAYFENHLKENLQTVLFEDKKTGAKLFAMQGAKISSDENDIYMKLLKAKQHVFVPNLSVFEAGKRKSNNDAFMIDTKTYYIQDFDAKRISSGSLETFKAHLSKAEQQANVAVIDLVEQISPERLIDNLKKSWPKGLKKVIVYYRGNFREIDRSILYDQNKMTGLIK